MNQPLSADIIDKFRTLFHGLIGGLKRRHLKNMPHSLVDIHLHRHVFLDHFLVKGDGVIQKDLVVPHLDIGGREAGKIPEKRGNEGRCQLFPGSIILNHPVQILFIQNRVRLFSALMALPGGGEIRPRRQKHEASWKKSLFLLQLQGRERARFPPAESPARMMSLAPYPNSIR